MMKRCPRCSRTYPPEQSFCPADQTPLIPADSSDWRRQFRQRSSIISIVMLLIATGFISSIGAAVLGGLLGVQHPLLARLVIIGLPVALFSLVLFCYWYFPTTQTIVCGPEGFTVHRESRRRGKTQRGYRWQDVTDTKYNKKTGTTGSGRNRRSYTYYTFEVLTAEGLAFEVNSGSVKDFSSLVQLFNQMTSQRQHAWQSTEGFGSQKVEKGNRL